MKTIILDMTFIFLLTSCIPKPPKSSALGRSNFLLDHTNLTSCRECHLKRSLSTNHRAIGTDECSKCHGTIDWNIHKGATSCSKCHEDNTSPITSNTKRPNSARYSKDHDPNLHGISHYLRAKLTGETNSQVDCIYCHVTTSWSFNHRRHNGSTLPICLPCHYQKGVSGHGRNSSNFGTYNFNNGQYGACANCHSTDFGGD